jgi:hypothetical protein
MKKLIPDIINITIKKNIIVIPPQIQSLIITNIQKVGNMEKMN